MYLFFGEKSYKTFKLDCFVTIVAAIEEYTAFGINIFIKKVKMANRILDVLLFLQKSLILLYTITNNTLKDYAYTPHQRE